MSEHDFEKLTPEDIIQAKTAEQRTIEESFETLGNLLAARSKAMSIFRKSLIQGGFRETVAEKIVRDWHLEYIATGFQPDEEEPEE